MLLSNWIESNSHYSIIVNFKNQKYLGFKNIKINNYHSNNNCDWKMFTFYYFLFLLFLFHFYLPLPSLIHIYPSIIILFWFLSIFSHFFPFLFCLVLFQINHVNERKRERSGKKFLWETRNGWCREREREMLHFLDHHHNHHSDDVNVNFEEKKRNQIPFFILF